MYIFMSFIAQNKYNLNWFRTSGNILLHTVITLNNIQDVYLYNQLSNGVICVYKMFFIFCTSYHNVFIRRYVLFDE